MRYEEFIPVLIQAVKEQDYIISEQAKQINDLSVRLKNVEDKLAGQAMEVNTENG